MSVFNSFEILGRPRIMSAISFGECFMYCEDNWLNANVLVETTIGTWCFQALSLPQKQTESVYTTSGRKLSNASARKLSILRVIRISCSVISVVLTFFSPASSCAVSGGRYASQETN